MAVPVFRIVPLSVYVLKGYEMKGQNGDVRRDPPLRHSGWLEHLFGPLIVGIVVLAGQWFIAPIVAKGVKTQESILEQRYKAYENAVNILQRHLASVKIAGDKVPQWYTPTEGARPSQVETNVAYTLLAIYEKNGTASRQFRYAIAGTKDQSTAETKKIDPRDIVKFISAVREELGVDSKGLSNDEFTYLFVRPTDANVAH